MIRVLMTNLDAYDYDLPPSRIAQDPVARREESRALFMVRGTDGAFPNRLSVAHQTEGGNFSAVSRSEIVVGEVVHAAIVRDAESLKIYFNGELEALQAHDGSITLNDEPLRLGAGGRDEVDEFFSGSIIEVRISNVALEPDDFLHIP